MNKKQYNEDIRQNVIALYNRNNNIAATAKEFGVSVGTVYRWVKGISKRTPPIGDVRKNEIISLYNNGLYSREISQRLNIGELIIAETIRKANIQRHRGPKSKVGNEKYFDIIDTEKKAYSLGWIMADGNVSVYNGQYSLKLNISADDRELIDGFLNEIEANYKVSIKQSNKGGLSAYVSITSKHMVQALIQLGVVPRKSGKEVVPDIDEELMPHFFRGYFDGDGTVSDSNGHLRSGFIASSNIIDSVQKIIGTNLKCYHPNNVSDGTEVYSFLWGKNDSIRFYHFIYDNATVWLKRKRIIFERYL
jgi:transposase